MLNNKLNTEEKLTETKIAECEKAVRLSSGLGALLDLDNLDLLYALRDKAENKYRSSENIYWKNLYSNIISDLHYLILFVEQNRVKED
jgi:hypothetical protein